MKKYLNGPSKEVVQVTQFIVKEHHFGIFISYSSLPKFML
jgi:hypothetical protein